MRLGCSRPEHQTLPPEHSLPKCARRICGRRANSNSAGDSAACFELAEPGTGRQKRRLFRGPNNRARLRTLSSFSLDNTLSRLRSNTRTTYNSKMAAPAFKFGSFDYFCNQAALTVCPLVGSQIEPECYARNVEISGQLIFQPGAILILEIGMEVLGRIWSSLEGWKAVGFRFELPFLRFGPCCSSPLDGALEPSLTPNSHGILLLAICQPDWRTTGALFGGEQYCQIREHSAYQTPLLSQTSATLVIYVIAIVMTSIMIYHIKSKYTAVGGWTFGGGIASDANIRCLTIPPTGRKEIVIFFYMYMGLVVLEFLLVSGIIPTASSVYPVGFPFVFSAARNSKLTCFHLPTVFHGSIDSVNVSKFLVLAS